MDHSRLLRPDCPLSPIPPMRKSSFDFSKNDAITFLQPSSTSDMLNISIPNLSPIKPANPSKHQLNSTNAEDDIDLDRFTARMESSLLEDNNENFLNKTNINNRRLTVGTILEDLGLTQYETLMKEMDLLSFFMLTDDDLKALGVTNPKHREIFKSATKVFCEI